MQGVNATKSVLFTGTVRLMLDMDGRPVCWELVMTTIHEDQLTDEFLVVDDDNMHTACGYYAETLRYGHCGRGWCFCGEAVQQRYQQGGVIVPSLWIFLCR